MKKLLFCIFFTCLLIGCGTSDNNFTEQTNPTDELNTTQSSTTDNDFTEQVIPNEEPNATQFSDHSFIAPLTEQEALDLATELNETIYNLSILLYDEFSEENANGPDPEIIELLKSYATDAFLENYVTTMEGDCVGGCYTIDTPWNIERGWQPKVTFMSETQFETSALFPIWSDPDMVDHDSYEETTTFILENDSWKMDSYIQVKKDMNLTVEDIEPYLMLHDYTIEDVGKEKVIQFLGQEEKVYPVNIEVDYPNNYLLFARTGYMHVLLDE